MKKLLLVSCISLALAAPAHSALLLQDDYADDEFSDEFSDDEFGDFYGGEAFVSIATGTRKSISKAPSVATVITSERIQELGVTNLYQLIETVTGIHVYPSNFNRMNSQFSIRGVHTRENPQVLVLVNNIRTTHNYKGAAWNLFNVGTEIIDRIEIIRGPGSAVHGADAFSGVINIVTKGNGGEFTNDVGVRSGSFGTKSAWLNYGTKIGDFDLSINAQWNDTDGDDSRIIEQDAMHAFGLAALSNAPSALDTRKETRDVHINLANDKWRFSYWHLSNEGGTGFGAAQALSVGDLHKDSADTLSLEYKSDISDSLSFSASTYYQWHDENTYFVIFPAGFATPRAFDPDTGAPTAFTVFTDGVIGNPILDETNSGIDLVFNYKPNSEHDFRLGIGFQRNEGEASEFKNFGPLAQDGTEDFIGDNLTDVTGTPFVFAPNESRDVYFVSVQDEWQLAKDWELTLGLRYDDYSDFGSTVNPRAALVWQAKHNLTAKALYGRAFRAPSFGELFAVNNPVVLGNPNLDPETINTVELAFDYRPNFDWKFLFNIFAYEADNLIVYIPQGDGSNLASNAGAQDGIGAELEIHWTVSEQLNLKLGYAFQQAEDADSGADIPDAPQNSLDFSMEWKISDDLTWHLDSSWITNRSRPAGDARPDVDNFTWVNSNFVYYVNSNLDLGLSIRNLLDEDAFEPSDATGTIPGDLPLEERGYWATMRYSF